MDNLETHNRPTVGFTHRNSPELQLTAKWNHCQKGEKEFKFKLTTILWIFITSISAVPLKKYTNRSQSLKQIFDYRMPLHIDDLDTHDCPPVEFKHRISPELQFAARFFHKEILKTWSK
jgi:hypothetical protein